MKKTVDLIRLGIFVVLMSAIPILCNMHFGTPALNVSGINVSGMLENEDIITKINIEILAPSTYDGYEISDKEDIETIIDLYLKAGEENVKAVFLSPIGRGGVKCLSK